MTPSIRLGRIFGIEVGFNWSLIFIFAWITWLLATTILPTDASGYPPLVYWFIAALGAVLFYACLLAHELSHALVARRNGVKVAGITLWLFGGVSRLEGEPASARSEALIAGVGPLTSFVVAAIAFGLALATTGNKLLADLFSWLTFVNVALGLFNLVPAFPLDGGRLLSSILWWRSGSRQKGVHNAVRVGRVFAYLMIAAGVLELFVGEVANGIWIAFLGWFLLSAAASEEAGSAVRTLLRSVPVSAAMTSPVVTLPDWVTVEQFLESVAPRGRAPYRRRADNESARGSVGADSARRPESRATGPRLRRRQPRRHRLPGRRGQGDDPQAGLAQALASSLLSFRGFAHRLVDLVAQVAEGLGHRRAE